MGVICKFVFLQYALHDSKIISQKIISFCYPLK